MWIRFLLAAGMAAALAGCDQMDADRTGAPLPETSAPTTPAPTTSTPPTTEPTSPDKSK